MSRSRPASAPGRQLRRRRASLPEGQRILQLPPVFDETDLLTAEIIGGTRRRVRDLGVAQRPRSGEPVAAYGELLPRRRRPQRQRPGGRCRRGRGAADRRTRRQLADADLAAVRAVASSGDVVEQIREPGDLRDLSLDELAALAGEIRDFIVAAVAENAGHLGSNLGVVELTLALHRVFDSPQNALLWDTGHQAYVHKLVTGRQAGFAPAAPDRRAVWLSVRAESRTTSSRTPTPRRSSATPMGSPSPRTSALPITVTSSPSSGTAR